MQKIFKLVFATVVLSLLTSCVSGDKPHKGEASLILGTWVYDRKGYQNYEIIFKEDGKVTIGKLKISPPLGNCKYDEEYEGSYTFNSNTNVVEFEDVFFYTRVRIFELKRCEEYKLGIEKRDIFTRDMSETPKLDYNVKIEGDQASIFFPHIVGENNATFVKQLK